METLTVTDFVLARIAEDETMARAATDGPWKVDDETYAEYIGSPLGAVVSGGRWGGEASVFDSTADAIHIARHDPARVLAQCAAMRTIVETLGSVLSGPDHVPDYTDGYVDGLDWSIRALASIWSSHQDFNPDWA